MIKTKKPEDRLIDEVEKLIEEMDLEEIAILEKSLKNRRHRDYEEDEA